MENYTLKTVSGKTELKVDMDITNEFMNYFLKVWPKALDKIKELAEKNQVNEFLRMIVGPIKYYNGLFVALT